MSKASNKKSRKKRKIKFNREITKQVNRQTTINREKRAIKELQNIGVKIGN